MGPTLILLPPPPPQACQAGILLQGQTLGKWQRFWKAESQPCLREQGQKMAMSRPWEGSLGQRKELGPGLPMAELISVQDLPCLGISWPGHGSGI